MADPNLAESVEAPTETQRVDDGPIPFLAVLGWGMGSLGVLTVLSVTNSLVLKYVVDIMGVSAIIAGSLIGATRIFDAVLDPFMGTVSDATETRWGRRRPYLLLGGIMCAISPIVIFAAPSGLSGNAAVVYIVGALLFYALAYTTFNVPYMAMPVEMTQDPKERTFMFSFRVYGSALAGLVGGGAAPWLVDFFGGGRDGFASMALVIGIFVLLACLSSFFLTGMAPAAKDSVKDHRPRLMQLRFALKNRPFVALMFMKIFLVAGLGVGASSLAFFVTVVLDRPLSWLGFIIGGLTVGMIVSQPFWVRHAGKVGKKRTFLIAAALYVVAVSSWLFADPDETLYALVIRATCIGLVAGGVFLTSQAMLPDTLEHEFEISGVRHEGVLTGIYTTIERGSSALGVAIAGAVLSAGGYIAETEGVEQPDSAITAIYVAVAVMPAIAMCLSAFSATKYKLPG